LRLSLALLSGRVNEDETKLSIAGGQRPPVRLIFGWVAICALLILRPLTDFLKLVRDFELDCRGSAVFHDSFFHDSLISEEISKF
jgi:hypothetical protein